MKLRAVAIMTTLFLVVGPAMSSGYRTVPVRGVGEEDCGVWVEHRKVPNDPKALEMEAWVNGFMTAADLYSNDGDTRLSREGMLVWMDRYCQRRPLDQVYRATRNLIYELKNPEDATQTQSD